MSTKKSTTSRRKRKASTGKAPRRKAATRVSAKFATPAKKAARRQTASSRPKGKTKAKAKAKTSGKRTGALDAAARVLRESDRPMKSREITGVMLKKGYWATKGKTPWATLYSAMLREIQNKGKAARFRKTDRGTFALRGRA